MRGWTGVKAQADRDLEARPAKVANDAELRQLRTTAHTIALGFERLEDCRENRELPLWAAKGFGAHAFNASHEPWLLPRPTSPSCFSLGDAAGGEVRAGGTPKSRRVSRSWPRVIPCSSSSSCRAHRKHPNDVG